MPVTTDAAGHYSVSLAAGDYPVRELPGDTFLGIIHVADAATPGDVFINGGRCSARYGAITDSKTGRAIAGATVNSTQTDARGWYRQDWYDCSGSCGLCSTTPLSVSAPGYASATVILGRGVSGVERLDVALSPAR